MSDSEITARFGADTSGFDRALRSVRGGLGDLGASGDLHLGKLAKGGKELKNLFHEMSAEVGGLGAAFKFAISPMAGVLAGVTAGFAGIKGWIDKINANSDKLEAGTADPIFRMRDALRDSKKAMQEFLEQQAHWERSQEKGPAEKLTEQLKLQLEMLDRQVAFAEKLSQKDKERLEHQKLLVMHGLQGRALMAATSQASVDELKMKDAVAGQASVLGRTSIASANSAIAEDEKQLAKLDIQLTAANNRNVSQPLPNLPLGPAFTMNVPTGDTLQEQKDADIAALQAQKRGIQERIQKNKDAIVREEQARRAAAFRTEEARSRLAASRGARDSLSLSIEQTRQAIVLGGGFDTTPPPTGTEAWLAASQSRLADWNKAHGMGSDLVSFSSLAHKNDEAGNSIATLNDMFKRIMTDAGMKVTMTIEDN